MQKQCKSCGAIIEESDKTCPYCCQQSSMLSEAIEPATIQELKEFCQNRKLPLEKMRFFIGQKYTEPKAFGIYQDVSGQYIVYKNKSDGKRAISYQGEDEALAVHEIYQKMLSEIAIRKNAGKIHPVKGSQKQSDQNKWNAKHILLLFGILGLIFVMGIVLINLSSSNDTDLPENGYYEYESNLYYYDDDWYLFDDVQDDWEYLESVDSKLEDDYASYYCSYDYSSEYGGYDFSLSGYFEENHSSDSDDWSWNDSDSWDSSETNWDSDW